MELGKKQFKFKGKTLEELKTLDVREFAKLLTSRQRRYVLRNFQEIEDFVKRSKVKISKNKQVKTHNRRLVIIPEMVDWKIHIYKGNSFEPIIITSDMLGHKFGEMAPTRKRVVHVKAAAASKAPPRK